MDWYDSYNIGVDRIDAQHQELAKMVSRVQAALVEGRAIQEIGQALRFLVDYTKQHFADEEKIMEAVDFDGLARHKELHRRLVEDVMQILMGLKKGKAIDPYAFVDFLTNWLLNHIRHEDKKIGRAVEAKHGQKTTM